MKLDTNYIHPLQQGSVLVEIRICTAKKELQKKKSPALAISSLE
jgi:hypothetical protein